MIREVILLPTASVYAAAVGGFGSAAPQPDPSPPTIAECWKDEVNSTFVAFKPQRTHTGGAMVLASFEAPPTLIVIKSVTLQAWWSYQQQGPNNWYFPPSNAYGPRFRMALRNRAGDGYLYGSYHPIAGAEVVDQYENANTHSPATYDGPLLLEWDMSAHPEGGPWTIDDLGVSKFAAGIEATCAAPCFDSSKGSFAWMRVHKYRVLLEVEDLGGYVDNIRHAGAMALRLMRRARNTITVEAQADKVPAELGEHIYLSHPHGPAVAADGWGRRVLERRPGLILKRKILPETFMVQDEVFDLQAFRCLGWAAYRIDAPWSPELQGLAFLDKGGGYTHTRDQDGWSPRPGDGVLMRVLPDYPNLSFHGLAVQGGGDVEKCLRNYDAMQSGWSTVGNTGDFSAAASTTVSLVEEQGYLSSALLAYGAGGATGGRARSLGTLAAGRVHVRVVVKNTTVPTPATQFAEWYLTDGTNYWNEATREWQASAAYNVIPSDDPFGEVVADCIPITEAAYTIAVGRFSSSLTSVEFHAALVNVQWTDATVAGCRTPLVTLDAPLTREADVHTLPNSLAAELWSYATGVAVAEVQPFWDAADLPDATVKPLLEAFHVAGTWDALQFVSSAAGAHKVRFERMVTGTPHRFDVELLAGGAPVNVTRAHVLRAWARWLGAEGWTEYGPYSVEVGFALFTEADGVLVATSSALGRLTEEGNVTDRSALTIGCDSSGRFVDAYVRMWEVRRNPISGKEAIWRV